MKHILIACLFTTACMIAFPSQSEVVARIGVWNIENLNTEKKRGFPELRGNDALESRTSHQLNAMADYLKDQVQADALMLTEIGSESDDSFYQLTKILSQLPGNWKFRAGKTGGSQRIVFAWNDDTIRLKELHELVIDDHEVRGKDIFDRDPLIAWIQVRKGGEDLLVIGLHLKSQQKFIHNHMAATATLLGFLAESNLRRSADLPSNRREKDIIILGDVNDSAFLKQNFKFMFDYLEGMGYEHARPAQGDYPRTRTNGSKIDHVFVSHSLKFDNLVDQSFIVHHIDGMSHEDYRAEFSDHYPVTVDLFFDDGD